jgi:hypothetical protein
MFLTEIKRSLKNIPVPAPEVFMERRGSESKFETINSDPEPKQVVLDHHTVIYEEIRSNYLLEKSQCRA